MGLAARPPRMMGRLSGLVLLSLLLLAAIGGWLMHGAGQQARALTELSPQSVRFIYLARRDQDDVVLQRTPDGWVMSAPFAALVRPQVAGGLLGYLTSTSHARLDARQHPLAEFGLEYPRARITLDDLELHIGADNPITGQRYVKLADTIHLISDLAFQFVVADAASLADPRLLYGQPAIRGVTVPGLIMTKRRGAWSAAPPERNVPAAAIERLADAWATARAGRVRPLSDELALGKVQIWTHAEQPIEFNILALQPELILARPQRGLQYHFDASSGRRLVDPLAP